MSCPGATVPGVILLCLCAAATPHSARASTGASPVVYYTLRFELSTTSDWSTLVFSDPRLLAMHVINQSGPPAHFSASLTSIALGQPCADALSCGTVTATVDYALAATSLDQPLSCSLEKGAWNSSNLQVSVVLANGQAQTLLKVTHNGYVAVFPNAVPATVDLSPLKSISPSQGPQFSTGPLVWAIYYPWYGLDGWSWPRYSDNPSIPYASTDPVAIARQVAQAQAAGVDGFICSWAGPTGWLGPEPMDTLLGIASQRGFKVTVYLEILDTNGKPQPASVISAWIAYLISTYGNNPAFYKFNGKPLIVVWASTSVTLDAWGSIFSSLHGQGLDASYIAMGYDTSALSLFDGLHQYAVSGIPNLAATEASVGVAVHGYPLLAATPSPKIWAATVQPGFDNRAFAAAVPGAGTPAVYDRANGALYRSTIDAALGSNPDWVIITSWNEWNENTEIEPSVFYGDLYLRLTRGIAERWKGIPTLSNVSAASFQGPTLAPESIASVFGTKLATQTAQAKSLPLPASLGGTTMTVVDSAGVSRAAPLFYVSPGQVNYALPAGMAAGEAQVTVTAENGTASSANVPVAAVAPGLFTINSSGLAAGGLVRVHGGVATNEDIFQIGNSGAIVPKPINLGSAGDQVFLILYGTGIRAAGTAGVAVGIGGVFASVSYAGIQGGYTGLDQVNVLLPPSLAGRGDVTIQLTANGIAANPVHVTIQ